MNEPTMMYGQLQSEKTAEENQICRQVVREISLFGVTERQRLLIIYLLALEVEDIERMRAITSTIKDLCGSELFLSGNDEVSRGSIDV